MSQKAPESLFFMDQAVISFGLGLSLSSKCLLFSAGREAAGGELLCKHMHCYGCPSQKGGSKSDHVVTVIRPKFSIG